MKLKLPILLIVFQFLFLKAYCSTTETKDTDLQFNSGVNNQTQVRDTGSPAYVQLRFDWENISLTPSPEKRRWHGSAYDNASGIIVLMGGDSEGTALDDLWEYNTNSNILSKITPSGSKPSKRWGHSMASLSSGEVLLFAGVNDSSVYSTATWIYNISSDQWNELIGLSTAPSQRWNMSMAKDTSNNKILLFGGAYLATKYNETWVFDVAQETWTLKFPASAPSARIGAGMCYNSTDGKIYLFGGADGSGNKQDLWTYNVNTNQWSELAPGGSLPSARTESCLVYDSVTNRIVLFGGSGYDANMWYYNNGTNKWYPGSAKDTPDSRMSFSAVYSPASERMYTFGGFNSGYYDDLNYYIFNSTGIYTSSHIDASFTTSLAWETISMEPTSPSPNVLIEFQIASSSTDNGYWGDFKGPDGSSTTYYSGAYSYSIWSGHSNRRYLKYRIRLESYQPPYASKIDSVSITYNRSPGKPVLAFPIKSGWTNCITPEFTWFNTTDSDNDIITYQVQVDNSNGFLSPEIYIANISSKSGTYSSYKTTDTLDDGTWYWRVRAKDSSLNGEWADYFTLFIDTIPPSAVTELSAQRGGSNGEISLSWVSPGNDDLSGGITNGNYEVRFATYGLVNETLYSQVSSNQRSGLYTVVSPFDVKSVNITGLEDATTYYLALKIIDEAGNKSDISTVSPYAYTNAPPDVYLSTPLGGETWSQEQEILWDSSDPNTGDTRTFKIYLSSNSGVSYDTLITTNSVQPGTTHYYWNTRNVCNGSNHRIKVVATDSGWLEGSSESPSDFIIDNVNEAPSVHVAYPNGGEVLSGTEIFTWSVTDPNLADIHTCDLYLSNNNGNTYDWHYTTSEFSYTIDTRGLPNGPSYIAKVTAADNGTPIFPGQDSSDASFSINNNNLPPNAFSLVYPKNDSYRSVLDFEFTWENNGDPNPEDTLSYTLIYSASSDFSSNTSVPSITNNYYRVVPGTLSEDVKYYWKVIAKDSLGLETTSNETYQTFVLNRSKAESRDGLIYAEVTQGMPENGYIKITKNEFFSAPPIDTANKNMLSERNLKLIDFGIYSVTLRTASDEEISVPGIRLLIKAYYPDTDNDGYLDNTLVKYNHASLSFIDVLENRWRPALSSVNPNEKTVTAAITQTGMITVLGAIAPASKISGVVNYPNPFSPEVEETRIRYVLTENSDVSIKIYTLLGDLVFTRDIKSGETGAVGLEQGYSNEITWDGKNNYGKTVANGMYILQIKASGESFMRKIGVKK